MPGPVRNLVIVHSPPSEDISDWLEVSRRIGEQAPDIEVRIANNFAPSSTTAKWQIKRPSLVFAASNLSVFRPRGGTIYAGHPMSKFDQINRLAQKGIPVPRTMPLTRGTAPIAAQMAPYLIVKPVGGGSGKGIRLVNSSELAARCDELISPGQLPMIVQPYIDHSVDGYPTEYRVLTMFGQALYAACNRWGAPRPPLKQIAADPAGVIASNNRQFGRVRTITNDQEVIEFGKRAHAAFPECAVLGVDVIRETGTGKLYALEVNPEGRTWHFSSRLGKTFTPEHSRDLYAQFSALDRVAQLLIEKTRAHAA
jgi:hypothetical protein